MGAIEVEMYQTLNMGLQNFGPFCIKLRMMFIAHILRPNKKIKNKIRFFVFLFFVFEEMELESRKLK